MNICKNNVLARGVCYVAALASLLLAAPSHAVRVSTTGMGQVLLFPYYTVQNDNVSLISLVNTTTQGKAVRLNLRDARGGYVTAQLNVYLSAKDVWTAAVVGTGDNVRLISNDRSCTAPALHNTGGLALTQLSPGGTGPGAARAESRREGYVEVIEMATIPNSTPTGISITHINGIAPCNRSITDVAAEPLAADLKAPSGGLTGTLSIVNVGQGMLVSTAATALENFWLTGPGAAAPRVWSANATQPGLDSGGDKEAFLRGSTTAYTPGSPALMARFARSLDAVTAVLMASSVYAEYAATADNTIAATIVITMPTKPYYIRLSNSSLFQSTWNDLTKESCDDFSVIAYDREEVTAYQGDSFPVPGGRNRLCYVSNTMPIFAPTTSPVNRVELGVPDASFLGAQFTVGFSGIQNGGVPVAKPGREGGWLELAFTASTAKMTPLDTNVIAVKNGKPELTKVNGVVYGLPAIGFTLSQSAFKQGSPQQNYADAVTLRIQTTILTEQP